MKNLKEGASLTEFEVGGLNVPHSFADGHAYHEMPAALRPMIDDLQSIWRQAASMPIPAMEKRFKTAVAHLIQSPVLEAHEHFSLSPTASNSIDIAAAWLKSRDYKVGLIEPAFDNLYLLLKRREVEVTSIQEAHLLVLDELADRIAQNGLKALFIVSPNNPTGFQMMEDEFRAVCNLCKEKDVAVVLDSTFRFYARASYDEYSILKDTGVDYLVIEDTGKTWPTYDTKVSLMTYSESIAPEVRTLYEEVYLCHSNLSVALLSSLIEKTGAEGLDKVVWREVDERKEKLRQAVEGTGLRFEGGNRGAPLPLAWLDCSGTGMNDLALAQQLKQSGVAVLPGRYFYWDSQEAHTDHVRVSLMRPAKAFDEGLKALKQALNHIRR